MAFTVPNTAPFTGAQKMWLKGYLDALNSALAPPNSALSLAPLTANTRSGLPVTILWGSQTGTCELIAKKLSKTLSSQGHVLTLREMSEVSPSDLAATKFLCLITSTYGDGEPPDNAASLHAALHAAEAPALAATQFTVLALGDSSYPDFCKCGHDFDTRLTALGARPFLALTEVDGDYDRPFAAWSEQLTTALGALVIA